jgi:hypothetical protein
MGSRQLRPMGAFSLWARVKLGVAVILAHGSQWRRASACLRSSAGRNYATQAKTVVLSSNSKARATSKPAGEGARPTRVWKSRSSPALIKATLPKHRGLFRSQEGGNVARAPPPAKASSAAKFRLPSSCSGLRISDRDSVEQIGHLFARPGGRRSSPA